MVLILMTRVSQQKLSDATVKAHIVVTEVLAVSVFKLPEVYRNLIHLALLQ